MTWKLHRKGYENAKSLIEAGKVNDGEWEKPDLKDFNDVEEYALFHLAVNPDADPSTAGAYAYPYGREGEVYLQALRAIRSSAAGARGATRNEEIFDAAGRLLEMINEKGDGSRKCHGDHCIQQHMILKVDEAERIVSGPVLVPGEPDLDGDIVTVEEVERAAYKFLEDYQNIDIMHNFRNVARPVESYILREDTVMGGVHLPRGTWMLSARIYDDSVWEGVRKGEYTGFSITAVPAAVKQKTTLRDLGGEWEVVTVSIVTNPAVPKARYLTVKGGENVDEKSVLKSIFESLKQYFESSPTMKEEEDVTDDGGAAMDVNETLKAYEESIKELREEIRALKEALKEGEDPEGDAPAPDEAVDEPAEEEDDDGGAPEPEPAPKSRDWQVGDDGPAVKSVYDEIGVDAYGRRVRKD